MMMEMEHISVEEINRMKLKRQNKELCMKVESLRRERDQLEKDVNRNQQQLSRDKQLKTTLRQALSGLEQTFLLAKRPGENRLSAKLQQVRRYLLEGVDSPEEQERLSRQISNVFLETFIELRRQGDDLQGQIEHWSRCDTGNDRIRIVLEQSKAVDKKYREIETRYQELLKERETEQREDKQSEETRGREEEARKRLLVNRLFRRTYHDSAKVDSVIHSEDSQCLCRGGVQSEETKPEVIQVIQVQPSLPIPEAQTEDISLSDQYKALLEEYRQKCNENTQLTNTLEEYENNLEMMFYQSQIFSVFMEQTGKLNDQNQKLKATIKELGIQIRNIESLRQKELDELEKIANFNLSKLQNELRQVQSQKVTMQKDSFDIDSHVKPLVEQLEMSDKSISNIRKERDLIFERSKRQTEEISQLKEVKNLLEERTERLQCQSLIEREHNRVDYESLAYKGGKYKELINQLNRVIMKSYPQLKAGFDELVLYLKTREQKIEYLEGKHKHLSKELKTQARQQEDLVHEIDLTGNNYADVMGKNRRLTQLVRDQEETFDQLAKEKFREKSKLEAERNILVAKVRVDQELITSQNALVYDLECQAQVHQGQAKVMGDLAEKQLEQVEALQSQLVRQTQVSMDKEVQLSQLEARQNKSQICLEENSQLNNQLTLQLRESQSFIDRRIASKRLQSHQSTDDHLSLQQLEFQQLKQKINCSVCQRNHKKVILSRCAHMFCKECLDKTLAVRNRACPICKNKFGQEDIKEIYFT